MRTVCTRWRQFITAQSMQKSQQVIHQGFTIWLLGKVIQKKKISRSLHWLFSTLESSSAHFTKIILTAKTAIRLPNKSKANQPNELKKTELRLVFIVFLAFLQDAGIYVLKYLAWMSRDFFTDPTTEISIYQNFYLLNFYLSSSNLNLLRSTPLNYSLTDKASIFLFSTSTGLEDFLLTTFLSDSNDLLIFFLSFFTRLGGFSSINLSSFLPQYSY